MKRALVLLAWGLMVVGMWLGKGTALAAGEETPVQDAEAQPEATPPPEEEAPTKADISYVQVPEDLAGDGLPLTLNSP